MTPPRMFLTNPSERVNKTLIIIISWSLDSFKFEKLIYVKEIGTFIKSSCSMLYQKRSQENISDGYHCKYNYKCK